MITSPAAQCPQDYSCQFTQLHPRVVIHAIGPWWHGMWGVIVAISAISAIGCLLAYLIYIVAEHVKDNRNRIDKEKQRKHQMAMEEQRTMQLDAAKGNPEMLKLVKSLDRNQYNY